MSSLLKGRAFLKESSLKEKVCARVSRGGNSPILYLPKKFFSPGDKVDCIWAIDRGRIELILTKNLYNFTIDAMRDLAHTLRFSIEYDKTIADVHVFDATHDDTSLSYTESVDGLEPARIVISRHLGKVNSKKEYSRMLTIVDKLKHEGFDAYLEPEGDLDSINVFNDLERYGLKDQSEAIEALRKSGKELEFSAIVRFSNEKDNVNDIDSALKELRAT